MAKKYYCLIAGLPDIILGDKKVLFNSVLLKETLQEELSQQDLEMAMALYLPFDHYNLISLLFHQQKEFDPRGVYSSFDLYHLTDKRSIEDFKNSDFPDYLVSSVKEILFADEKMSPVEAEMLLYRKYIDYLKSFSNPFLDEFIQYEVNVKNVFIALTGKKYGLDYETELIGKGDVVDALQKSRSRDFGLAAEIDHIELILQTFENENLLERELKIDQLKWEFLDEAIFFHYFTIERILGFIYKLFMVERWISLSEEDGMEMFRKLLGELESSYEFPEEFKLSHGKKK